MGAELPTGRLVFFFSDVEGSTRLLTDLGDRFAALHAEHQRLLRSAFAAHGGVEISTEGDSFFAVFRSPRDALAAAGEATRSLDAHPWPAGHPFRVRIGLHVGQAILAGDTYVGIDVNRAARIANAANGGQVVVSDETAEAVAGDLPDGLLLQDLGRHRLRDIGVVHLWQLMIAGLPTRAEPLRTLEAHPSNLPIETTELVDRETERQDLAKLVVAGPIVTVTGTGGIGKSRLAVHVARTLLGEFPDGVHYLDLAPIDTGETIVAELATLLGARPASTGDAAEALVAHLRSRRALLVLETVDRHPGIAGLLSRIAESSPATRVLVTARSPLHLRAERELSIPPLAIPGPRPDLDGISSSPAVDLFVRRAQAVSPGFRLTASNAAAVAGIVERLDGVALAVELAAAGVRVLSPAAILARLEGSMPLPGDAAIDLPERQRTVHATIAWSYGLLASPEQRLLQRLSVFMGDFDLDALAAVAVDGGAGPEVDGLEGLGRLLDRSLVQRVMGDEDRYRLLGIIREFAAAELETSGDADAVRARHAAFWLGVAMREVALLDGPDEAPALRALDRAADELRAGLAWAVEADQADHVGLRFAIALGRAWYLRGRVEEGASWLERALAADPAAPLELRMWALHWLGILYDEQRDAARAIGPLEQALAIARQVGDDLRAARELNSLGIAHWNLGQRGIAEAMLGESLAERRRLGDTAGIATVLTNLGLLAIEGGRLDRAVEILTEAVAIDRASGAGAGAAYSSIALGTALLRGGRRDEALTLFRSAILTFQQLDDADGVAEILERLAEAARTENPPVAARLVLAARAIRERERRPLRDIDAIPERELFARIANGLSPEELAAARADASAMDVEAAVSYALVSLAT